MNSISFLWQLCVYLVTFPRHYHLFTDPELAHFGGRPTSLCTRYTKSAHQIRNAYYPFQR